MRKGFTGLLTLAAALIGTAWSCTCAWCSSAISLGIANYADPPTVATFNNVIRRDLLAGRMPQQAAPTERATRPRRDQRPGLRAFTLPRNDFAF